MPQVQLKKQYPDFSNVSSIDNLYESEERPYSPLVAMLLFQLPVNSLIVYSGPSVGETLKKIIPFLRPHTVKLIENYS